jgi:hypothetical protein
MTMMTYTVHTPRPRTFSILLLKIVIAEGSEADSWDVQLESRVAGRGIE